MSLYMGEPGTPFYTETNLLGTMLVDPSDPTVAEVLSTLDCNIFTDSVHRIIWRAAQKVGTSADAIAYEIWRQSGNPKDSLPSATALVHQLVLSENWISTASIKAYAGKLLLDRDKRQILSQADSLRNDRLTLQQFVDFVVLYAEQKAIHGR